MVCSPDVFYSFYDSIRKEMAVHERTIRSNYVDRSPGERAPE